MSALMEKVEVRFGRGPTDGAAANRWRSAHAGIPGAYLGLGAAQLPNPPQAVPAPPAVNTLDETGVVLKIPFRGKSYGNVRCVSIAPDSPIEAVDMYINGQAGVSVHRLSSWSPWFGELTEADTVRIVPIREIPYLGWQNNSDTAAITLKTVFWDMPIEKDPGIAVGGGAPNPNDLPSVQMPVRLTLHRGDSFAQPGKRAPYHASVVYNTGDAGGGAALIQGATLYMIVDGRRRFRVIAGCDGAGVGGIPTLSISGIEGYKSTMDNIAFQNDINPDRRLDAPSYDELLAATALNAASMIPTIYDYGPGQGNPYFAIIVSVDYPGVAGGKKGYIQVHSWDD